MKSSISITIPAFNEEESIEMVVKEACQVLDGMKANYEILLINDGSTDGTKKIISKLVREKSNIRAIHHKKNKGFSGAIKSCYFNASKDLIFLAPADGQVSFRELHVFLEKMEKGFDVVVGYRIQNGESLQRKLNSKLFHIICSLFFGLRFKEITTAILWKKKVIDSITFESSDSGALIELEAVYKAKKKGYKIGEVPFHFLSRKGGVPKGGKPGMIIRTLYQIIAFWWKVRLYR